MWVKLTPLFILLATTQSLENLCASKCTCFYNNLGFSEVNCKRSSLDAIPDNRQLPHDVQVLDIAHNEVRSVTMQENDFESHTLKRLLAGHNAITEISAEFMVSVPNLERLDLGHNEITQLSETLFDGSPMVTHLDLSHNQLASLPDGVFDKLARLKYLDLSGNNIGALLMKYNTLVNSSLGISGDITHLLLASVGFKTIPKLYLEHYNLTHISLADNDLEVVPKVPYSVQYLDLSGNNFKVLDVHHLDYQHLRTLKLNRLPLLQAIESYAFYNMQALESLSLEHCGNLKELNDSAFGVLLEAEEWKLKRFSIAGSGIRMLNVTYFKLFNVLDEVDLGNNPWICDCNIIWLHWLGKTIVRPETVRCAAPMKLRNRELNKLDSKDFAKCVAETAWRTHKILVTIITLLVVVLVSIVIYLIYLGPFIKSGLGNYVGATSPYSNQNSLIINGE